MKKFLLPAFVAITVFNTSVYAGEKAIIRKRLHDSIICGSNMDFTNLKKYCTKDYIKIGSNGKVMKRQALEATAALLKRLDSPDCTFSEVYSLNAKINNIPISAEQLAYLQKRDRSEQAREQLRKFREAMQNVKNSLKELMPDLVNTIKDSQIYISGDTAIFLHRTTITGKNYFGMILLKKENNQWNISREMVADDSGNDGSQAAETEVRNWAKKIFAESCNTEKATDNLKSYAHDVITVLPDGKTFNYHQAEKILKFKDLLLKNSEVSMVELMPMLIEGYGGTVTAEMVKHYAGLDKSGQGREYIAKMRNKIKKYDEQLKKLQDKFQIKHIFIHKDIVVLVENYQLPPDRNVESVLLLKKEQGKYFIYRSAAKNIGKNR